MNYADRFSANSTQQQQQQQVSRFENHSAGYNNPSESGETYKLNYRAGENAVLRRTNTLCKVTPSDMRRTMAPIKDMEQEVFDQCKKELFSTMVAAMRKRLWQATYMIDDSRLDEHLANVVFQRLVNALRSEKFFVITSNTARNLLVSWDPILAPDSITNEEKSDPRSNANVRLRQFRAYQDRQKLNQAYEQKAQRRFMQHQQFLVDTQQQQPQTRTGNNQNSKKSAPSNFQSNSVWQAPSVLQQHHKHQSFRQNSQVDQQNVSRDQLSTDGNLESVQIAPATLARGKLLSSLMQSNDIVNGGAAPQMQQRSFSTQQKGDQNHASQQAQISNNFVADESQFSVHKLAQRAQISNPQTIQIVDEQVTKMMREADLAAGASEDASETETMSVTQSGVDKNISGSHEHNKKDSTVVGETDDSNSSESMEESEME